MTTKTRADIRLTAGMAARGDRKAMAELKKLAQAAHFTGKPGGWIYREGYSTPVCQGWAALATKVEMGGPTSWILDRIMTALEHPLQAACANPWHRSAPARERMECPECRVTPAPVMEPELGFQKEILAARVAKAQEELAETLDRVLPEDGLEVPTKEETLAAIGGCWAGGALTGKALKAWERGDYVLAMALATDQKALQAKGGPDAHHPETLAYRMDLAETLGDVAQDILDHVEWAEVEERQARVAKADQEAEAAALALAELKVPTPAPSPERDLQLAAYSPVVAIPSRWDLTPPPPAIPFTQVGPGIYVAPMGTPAPGPEDLADLAHTLAEELVEHLDPEEVRAPLDPSLKCQPRDVVTIHRGTRLYLVERVEVDFSRSRPTGEITDHTMALVSPVDPDDLRDPQWVHVDLLHVRRPVAVVRTVASPSPRIRHTPKAFRVEGPGFSLACGETRVVQLLRVDSRRFPVATLIPGIQSVTPVATLRVGEAIVVDGRCYAVELEDATEERATLVPAPHRDRLHLG